MRVMIRAGRGLAKMLCNRGGFQSLTGKAFKTLIQALDGGGVDIPDVCHQIGHLYTVSLFLALSGSH